MALKPLQRFFRLLKLDRKDISYIYLYAIFSGFITLSLPLGVQAIIGLIAGGAITASVIILVIIVTMGATLSGLLKVMQLSVTETIQQRIFSRSAFDFSYRLPRLQFDKLAQYYPPELVNRFFDTLTLQKGLPKILMDFSTAVLQILFGLLLISFYHPFFVFFGLILVVILVVIFRYSGPAGLATSLQESKYKYEVAHWLEELARSMSSFKLSGNRNYSLSKTDSLVSKYLDSRKAHFRVLLFQFSSIVIFEAVITAALLALGSYLVINNQINIGQFVAAEIVVILVITSLEKLILTMDTIYDVLTALEKIGSVTDLPLEREDGVGFEQIDRGEGIHVKIEDLAFQYEGTARPTLEQFNLEIKPGERLCVAGYNNSGKTTLLHLVAGLYTNFTGTIAYNGIPMGNINLESLRSYVGDFLSEENIFRGTLMENITLGNPDIGLNAVVQAAQQLGLDSFIQRLPQGYDSPLLPEGRNIPKSIRAKIILARSIVAKPRLLVVEGFLRSLEPADRLLIARCLTQSDQPWTLLLVTNDPILASRCDRVVILENGRLVASGNYEEISRTAHFRHVFRPGDEISSRDYTVPKKQRPKGE